MSDKQENKPTHYCYTCNNLRVSADHANLGKEHAIDMRPIRRGLLSGDRGSCKFLGYIFAGLLVALVVLGLVFLLTWANANAQENLLAEQERAELLDCRLRRYVTERTERQLPETVQLSIKTTKTAVHIVGDGLVVLDDVDPLDVFVGTPECEGLLSDRFAVEPPSLWTNLRALLGEPPPDGRCKIEQYVLSVLPPHLQVDALPADLKLKVVNDNGVSVIKINDYVAFLNVDAAKLLQGHEVCETAN